MDGWRKQLEGAGKSLSSTQGLVSSLRGEIGNVLLQKEGERGIEEGRGAGWMYFIVGVLGSLGVIGLSMYYFKDSLPFQIKQ